MTACTGSCDGSPLSGCWTIVHLAGCPADPVACPACAGKGAFPPNFYDCFDCFGSGRTTRGWAASYPKREIERQEAMAWLVDELVGPKLKTLDLPASGSAPAVSPTSDERTQP